jgi:ABC-2 type transport system permease protein
MSNSISQINCDGPNYYGTWGLIKKETLRFIKVYHQTLFSPVINILLLLAIFSVAVGKQNPGYGISFKEFMASGLIMMAAMQNAFANSSSSFVMGKVLGNIIDYLIPPISAGEVLFAMVVSSILRGLLVALICFVTITIFVPLPVYSFFYALLCLLLATMFLGLLGMLCGVISNSFDHMAAITSYIITPLTFLSGTFYSTNNLPDFWRQVSHFNPFFYMIDGFRYALTGYHDGNLMIGALVMVVINIILWIAVYLMLNRGYRIKN